MNLTLETYTTTMPATVLPGNLLLPSDVEIDDTSSAEIRPSWLIGYPHPAPLAYPEIYREGFIGILTDEEAREMKEGISLFKKRFDDDLARRHKILFGK